MAMWKLGATLDALQKEFGQEPGTELITNTKNQVDLLKPLIEQAHVLMKRDQSVLKRLTDRQTKRPSKKKKHRRS
jgi:hypothetical protein